MGRIAGPRKSAVRLAEVRAAVVRGWGWQREKDFLQPPVLLALLALLVPGAAA